MLLEISTLLVVLTAAIQAGLCFGSGYRTPVGDENEYLSRARSDDPYGPNPFLRVPLMIFFARRFASGGNEQPVRNALAMVAVATTLFLGLAGYLTFGPVGAVMATMLYLLLPDRMILSQHLWPDTMLALYQSMLLFMLSVSAILEPPSPWIFGLVIAAAAMTRIDGILLAPAVTLALVAMGENARLIWPGIGTPMIAALAAVSWHNQRNYRIPWPDTTSLFNISILAGENKRRGEKAKTVEHLVQAAWPVWNTSGHSERRKHSLRACVSIIQKPYTLLLGFVRRGWQMVGGDFFSIEVLLDANTGAYREMSPRIRKAWVNSLRFSFPLLLGLSAAGMILHPSVRPLMIPAGTCFLLTCLIHARTRFRFSILPSLCFSATACVAGLPTSERAWPTAVLVVSLMAVFSMSPGRRERPG